MFRNRCGSAATTTTANRQALLSIVSAASLLMEDDFMGPGSNVAMSRKNPGVTIAEERSADTTLSSYSAAVSSGA